MRSSIFLKEPCLQTTQMIFLFILLLLTATAQLQSIHFQHVNVKNFFVNFLIELYLASVFKMKETKFSEIVMKLLKEKSDISVILEFFVN